MKVRRDEEKLLSRIILDWKSDGFKVDIDKDKVTFTPPRLK